MELDTNVLQRRLNKSIKVAQKLKQKNLFESEANKELAKRNHVLRRSVLNEQQKIEKVKSLVSSISMMIQRTSGGDSAPIAEYSQSDLVSYIEELKVVLSESYDVPTPNVDEAKSRASRRQSSLFVHLPELSGTSLLRKSAEAVHRSQGDILEAHTPDASDPSSLLGRHFELITPLFEHFIVVGASTEAANEFAAAIQAFEDDSLSNRFMRTLGGFLSHPRFTYGNNGLKTPSAATSAAPSNNQTPLKALKEDQAGESEPERRDSVAAASAAEVKGQAEGGGGAESVPTSASKSIFSYFSRSSINAAAQPSLSAHVSSHNSSEATPTAGDPEKDDKPHSVDESFTTHSSVESLVKLEMDELESTISLSPIRDAAGSEAAQSTPHMEESPTKSTSNLIAGTASNALKGFGGMLTRLSSASDKTAAAAVQSVVKGKVLSMPSLGRNRSSSNATEAVEVQEAKPVVTTVSSESLGIEVDTVATASVESLVPPPIEIPPPPLAAVAAAAAPPPVKVASAISSSDKKAGIATTDASILYRYPPSVEPPPSEITDFCLPLGGKLRRICHKDEDTMVQEILFGHSHSKRSGRCFIFLLDDKTTVGDVIDEETGIGTGRLYGVCVVHPRLLKTSTEVKHPQHRPPNHTTPKDGDHHGVGDEHRQEFFEFESSVCYAFITRFPLFDFFFQTIFDMITLERLVRMEMAVDQSDADMKYSRNVYQYLPRTILENCLERLTRIAPPKYNEKLTFSISKSIQTIESYRAVPREDFPEHYVNAADWALPSLFSWLHVETLVWALSLLMSEAKLIVVGYDSGLVSCAVMGLLVMLRPLEWVAPLIPMLPLKLIDFIESPVPILAGLTLDNSDKSSNDIHKLIDRCSSDTEDGTILAILDVTHRELFVSSSHRQQLRSFAMPNSDTLCDKLKSVMKSEDVGLRTRPSYAISSLQKTQTRHAHDVFTSHIQAVIAMAQVFTPKVPVDLEAATLDFSDEEEEGDEEDDEEGAQLLLAYYSNIVGDEADAAGPPAPPAGAARGAERDPAAKSGGKAFNKSASTRLSISSQGSNPISAASASVANHSTEPIRLSGEALSDSDTEGFLMRFCSTQLFSEHVRLTETPAEAQSAEPAVAVDNQSTPTGGDNPRLSLNRRQSMNLMITSDHKLRLANQEEVV